MGDASLEKLADPTQWHVMPAPRSDAQLMPPPAPRPPKHRQRVVLSEEEYTEAVGKIIERDFFPDLPKLQQQLQVRRACAVSAVLYADSALFLLLLLQLLEATKSGDARIMREVTRRILSEQRKFGMTPTPARSVLSSPMHSEIADSEADRAEDAEKPTIRANMRLDQFMVRPRRFSVLWCYERSLTGPCFCVVVALTGQVYQRGQCGVR
jgi:protein DGCR14